MSRLPSSANPGGQIHPAQIVGRDALISRLWQILGRQSLMLSAERRIGKTSLMKKMLSEAKGSDERVMVYHDLEKVNTRLEFVEVLFHDVEQYLSRYQRTARRAREFLARFGGAEVKGIVKLPNSVGSHWKVLLGELIDDLMEQNRAVFFFWDEFPIMLINIQAAEGTSAATELLDMLRSLRQMQPQLRMVLAGSVSILNFISRLRQTGYANAPLNDVYTQVVPPLSPTAAAELAGRLLAGEGVAVDDPESASRKIAAAVDHLPFYIHHVVDRLAFLGSPYSEALLEEILTDSLTNPDDPWDLDHYAGRIPRHYTEAERPIAFGFLDTLADSDMPLPFEELWNRLASELEVRNTETAKEVLRKLQRDHYITRDSARTYRFVFPLVQRWWRLQRC